MSEPAKPLLVSGDDAWQELLQRISVLERELKSAKSTLSQMRQQTGHAGKQLDLASGNPTQHRLADFAHTPTFEDLEIAVFQREQYLTAIADIQRELLLVSTDTKQWYDRVVQKLRVVASASRVYIFEAYQTPDGNWFVSQKAEACAPGIPPEINNPNLQHCHLAEISFLGKKYLQQETVSALVKDLPQPARQHLAEQGIRSVLGIPFQVQYKFAGFVGFDNCIEERVWDASEVEFLTSATMAIALTMERLQAERAKRYSEARYRAIFEQSTVGVATVDQQNRILQVNQAYCKLLGYNNQELVNLPSSQVIHPDDWHRAHQAFTAVTTPPYQSQTLEKRYICQDGQVRWVNVYLKAVVSEGKGQLEFVIRTCVDITDRKVAELRLNEINQNLEGLVSDRTQALQGSLQEKEVLLKEVHHRVKNNLQIICSLLHMQARRASHQQVIKPLHEAKNRVKAMALLHEQLYRSADLSKINMASYLDQLVQHLINTYTHHKNVEFHVQADERQITINTAIPCGLIVTELVSNALKHAFPQRSGGQVSVEFQQQSNVHETTRMHKLVVQDDGVGYIPDFNSEAHHSLGLLIVQDLVKQLDGEINVTFQLPSERQGTCFEILFLD